MREPFAGRMWGVWNVEGEPGDGPVAILPDQVDAENYIKRCWDLPEDSDYHLTEYHHAFPIDIVGAWWNSHDPDPRADDPLTPQEILAEYEG